MTSVRHLFPALLIVASLANAAPARSGPCPRFAAGAPVVNPPDLYSNGGTLTVDLSYHTAKDAEGRTLYCFTTADGLESPTLHLRPGDRLIVNVTNRLPAAQPATSMQMATNARTLCGAGKMDASSVNLHWHGANISPTCHSDEVIHTLINSGETFTYHVLFPLDEPPGLYWYHPHVHKLAEPATQGGASGVIVVEGLEKVQPAITGLKQRLMVVRDQVIPGSPEPGGKVPSWDLTLNYVPISYPALTPAVVHAHSGEPEFWRVLNASADTILDIALLYDGAPQKLQLVAVDGVPVGSQDGAYIGTLIPITHFWLPPASRAEFIVRMPTAAVRKAEFMTRAVNTGPDGDSDPRRTLALIAVDAAREQALGGANRAGIPTPEPQPRFPDLSKARVTATRRLFFSENETQFFITLDGHKPQPFSVAAGPAIVTRQGAVEDWTIENRSRENHAFHIHQIHFQVRSQDNFEINGSHPEEAIQGQVIDTIDVPYWDGNPNHPYPSVTLRMDFRGPVVGDFVYHCHILEHEDGGMMAIIRVLPPAAQTPLVTKKR